MICLSSFVLSQDGTVVAWIIVDANEIYDAIVKYWFLFRNPLSIGIVAL